MLYNSLPSSSVPKRFQVPKGFHEPRTAYPTQIPDSGGESSTWHEVGNIACAHLSLHNLARRSESSSSIRKSYSQCLRNRSIALYICYCVGLDSGRRGLSTTWWLLFQTLNISFRQLLPDEQVYTAHGVSMLDLLEMIS